MERKFNNKVWTKGVLAALIAIFSETSATTLLSDSFKIFGMFKLPFLKTSYYTNWKIIIKIRDSVTSGPRSPPPSKHSQVTCWKAESPQLWIYHQDLGYPCQPFIPPWGNDSFSIWHTIQTFEHKSNFICILGNKDLNLQNFHGGVARDAWASQAAQFSIRAPTRTGTPLHARITLFSTGLCRVIYLVPYPDRTQ